MKANVTVRPNVFVRHSTELSKDSEFLLQVRGRKALVTVLRRISPSSDLQSAARAYFSQRQIAELAWDVPCAECGGFPEGAVKRNGKEEIEFRCPRQRCQSQQQIGRRVLLDPELVERLIRSSGESLTELTATALAGFEKSRVLHLHSTRLRRPYTIRVTSSQNYFFTDADIEDALRKVAEEWRG